MVGIEITGLPEIAASCKRSLEILVSWNEKATHQNMVDLKNEAVKLAPYKTGELKRSITRFPENLSSTSEGVTTAQYGSDLPYARIIELGGTIKEHTVLPKHRASLAWYDPSNPHAAKSGKFRGWVFTKQSVIKAQHRNAKPYLFPVLVIGIDRCLERYKTAYQSAMEEISSSK